MRIEEVYIEGFGSFADVRIGPFEGSVSVIFGSNEAGKSTLLAFIRTMLFGFPFRHGSYYPPQAGGKHGGRITIIDEPEGRIHLERFAGPRGGLLTVTSEGGAPLGQSVINKLLGNATEDLFKNIFAFSLDELQNKESLNNESVTDQIYSAGLGVSRLPQALNELRTERDLLLRPRGRSQIGDLLEGLREVDSKLVVINGNATEYGRLMARQTVINDQLDEADSEKSTLIAKQRNAQNLNDGWEDWLTLREAETILNQMPRYDQFPTDAVVRLEQQLESLQLAQQDSIEVSDQLELAEAEAQSVVEDDNMLEDQVTIERLRRDRESLDRSIRDLPERERELQELEESFSDQLHDLNPKWDEIQFESFDMSIATRDELAQWQKGLGNFQGQVNESERQLQQNQQTLSDRESSVAEANQVIEQTEEPVLDSEGLEQCQAALRAARTRLAEFQQTKQRHEDLSYQLSTQTQASFGTDGSNKIQRLALPILAALAAAVFIVAGFISGEGFRLFGVVAGAALFGLAIFLYFKSRKDLKPSVAKSNDALNDLMENAREAIDQSAAALSVSIETIDLSDLEAENVSATDLDGVEAKLANLTSQLATWARVIEMLSLATRDYERQEKRMVESSELLAHAQEELKTAEEEWHGWLRQMGLPETFAPETVIEFRARVDAARQQLDRINAMRRRIKAIQYDIEEYRLALEPIVLKYNDLQSIENQSQLGVESDQIIERFDTARRLVERRDLHKQEAEKIKISLEQRETRRLDAEKSLGELLEAGGATDPEDLRNRALQYSDRQHHEGVKNGCQSSLRRLSGPGSEFDEFCQTLSRSSRPQIDDDISRILEHLDSIETSRKELLQERGSNETLLSQLTSEDESSEMRLQRDVLIEKLRVAAREWSKNRIADWYCVWRGKNSRRNDNLR